VGPTNEEIYVDKYGRVKVQFYWDRQGKKNENSSCWIRVSSGWAGKNWGMIQLPRIGQEVVIEFLDGDPDEPVIVGRLYNGTQMPPYDLPANSTQSGIKSRSSKGGGASDSNELRFEDKTGSEEVYFHAQKDLDTVVENDETLKVGNDRTTEVTNDDTRTVKGKDTLTVTKDQTIAIESGNQSITLDEGDQSISVVKGNQEISIAAGNQQIELDGGDQSITLASGSQTIEIETGNQTITLAQGNQAININSGNLDTSLGMGNYTLKLDLGQISQQAMQGIELTVGQNSISIDQTGITIKGMMVSIQGQVQTELKGAMTTVNGDGMLTLKGGITMIN
jgi:type VI secretion system secreted protein VgrG